MKPENNLKVLALLKEALSTLEFYEDCDDSEAWQSPYIRMHVDDLEGVMRNLRDAITLAQ